MTEDKKAEFIIECLNSKKDGEILAGLVQIPFNTPENIPGSLIIKHIKNNLSEIKINVMQALGCYRDKYHQDIVDYIKTNELNIEELIMLQTALTTQYSDFGFSYFYDLLKEDKNTKEIAIDMLSKYEDLVVIPLLSKIDEATEEELSNIKNIYKKIGKDKAIRVVQGIPYYPLTEKMLKIFSEEELKEIYEN